MRFKRMNQNITYTPPKKNIDTINVKKEHNNSLENKKNTDHIIKTFQFPFKIYILKK